MNRLLRRLSLEKVASYCLIITPNLLKTTTSVDSLQNSLPKMSNKDAGKDGFEEGVPVSGTSKGLGPVILDALVRSLFPSLAAGGGDLSISLLTTYQTRNRATLANHAWYIVSTSLVHRSNFCDISA